MAEKQLKKTKFSVLKAQVKLWQDDGVTDTKELQTKMGAYLNDRQIVDEDGTTPLEVATIYLETGIADPNADADNSEEMGKALDAAVEKRFQSWVKTLPAKIGKSLDITGGTVQNDDRRTWGFKTAAEYVRAVQDAGTQGKSMDVRLKASATTYGQEFVGTDGGFAVPPDFINQIMRDPLGEQSILTMTNVVRVNGNNLTVPTDETTPWQTSGGILAYWTGEAAAMTQSKPALKQINLVLDKLTILVPMTDELLQDSSALVSYLPQKANENLDFKLGEGIFRGTGAGMPQGFLNSATTVSVAAEAGQAADTVNVTNVAKMLSRAVNPGDAGWAWFISPSVIPQLLTMTLGNVPAFLPFNAPVTGAVGNPVLGYLFGKPVYVTQHCNTVGDVGDIVLVNLKQYISAVKTNGVDAQQSIHLWFDQNLTAFRFVFRMAGQTWRSTPVTPRSGNLNLSSFITLAAR